MGAPLEELANAELVRVAAEGFMLTSREIIRLGEYARELAAKLAAVTADRDSLAEAYDGGTYEE